MVGPAIESLWELAAVVNSSDSFLEGEGGLATTFLQMKVHAAAAYSPKVFSEEDAPSL